MRSAKRIICRTNVTKLTHYGKIADRYLQSIKFYNKGVKVDKYVIMPNHIHAIIIIYDNGGQGSARPTNILSTRLKDLQILSSVKTFGKRLFMTILYATNKITCVYGNISTQTL